MFLLFLTNMPVGNLAVFFVCYFNAMQECFECIETSSFVGFLTWNLFSWVCVTLLQCRFGPMKDCRHTR